MGLARPSLEACASELEARPEVRLATAHGLKAALEPAHHESARRRRKGLPDTAPGTAEDGNGDAFGSTVARQCLKFRFKQWNRIFSIRGNEQRHEQE